jgi:integrase/recombinase XerD
MTMGACDPISEEQFGKMLWGCTGPYRLRDQCLMEFLGSTGYRISEALSVTIGQVWDGAKVKDDIQVSADHMKKKTPRDRVILHPDCKAAIVKWLTQLEQTFGLLELTWKLFCGRKSHGGLTSISREHAFRIIRAVATSVGIVTIRVGTHSFRKYLAIKVYLHFKKDLLLVQQVLGHISIDSTRVYVQKALAAKDVRKAYLLPRRRHAA